MNRNRIRNLVHWKLMILLTIVIWIGISKVAAAPSPYEVEEQKKEAPLQVVGEVKSHTLFEDVTDGNGPVQIRQMTLEVEELK